MGYEQNLYAKNKQQTVLVTKNNFKSTSGFSSK